jgi:hypothetical protein
MAQDRSRTAAKAGNLELEALPETKTAKNRMHYDLRAPAQHRPRPLRLEQLRARATALEHHEHHTAMADPQGSEF